VNIEARSGWKSYVPSRLTLLVLAAAILGLGLVAWGIRPSWSWGRIGSFIALIAVVLVLFRDQIFKYGDDTENEQQADSGHRPLARVVHPFIYAIGIPLVILGGVYQIVGDPPDATFLRIDDIPKHIVYRAWNSNTKKLDLEGLDKGLATMQGNIKLIDDKLGALSYPEFLVMNCGIAKVCQCPVGYSPVKDSGKWDLNSAAGGDKIRLCMTPKLLIEIRE
jgi:hypothetical protein